MQIAPKKKSNVAFPSSPLGRTGIGFVAFDTLLSVERGATRFCKTYATRKR
jgi:hypothetical protein